MKYVQNLLYFQHFIFHWTILFELYQTTYLFSSKRFFSAAWRVGRYCNLFINLNSYHNPQRRRLLQYFVFVWWQQLFSLLMFCYTTCTKSRRKTATERLAYFIFMFFFLSNIVFKEVSHLSFKATNLKISWGTLFRDMI